MVENLTSLAEVISLAMYRICEIFLVVSDLNTLYNVI